MVVIICAQRLVLVMFVMVLINVAVGSIFFQVAPGALRLLAVFAMVFGFPFHLFIVSAEAVFACVRHHRHGATHKQQAT
jgi:uncharacterized protein YqhQ